MDNSSWICRSFSLKQSLDFFDENSITFCAGMLDAISGELPKCCRGGIYEMGSVAIARLLALKMEVELCRTRQWSALSA